MVTSTIKNIQNDLSFYQAIPLVGPVIVSPIKALASTVQIVVSFVTAMIFGTVALFAELINNSNKRFSQDMNKSLNVTFDGIKHLLYAKINMLTLGIFGLIVEISKLPPLKSILTDKKCNFEFDSLGGEHLLML